MLRCRIWLVDLAKELANKYPSARLHGYDISTAQFPPKKWLPKNVNLDTLDIMKPIPDSLRGQFDVVHTGYLCLVVEKGDPFPILDNLLALLSTCASRHKHSKSPLINIRAWWIYPMGRW